MTREVAIDLLSMIEFEQAECCLNTWYKGIDDDMKEALDMAIKALEQQTCEDAISRKEAILQIQRYGVGCFDSDEFSPEQCERFVINRLNSLPFVSTEKTKIDWNYGEIKELTNKYHPAILNNYLEDDLCIKNLPSVSTEKTWRWIPVSEKLPDCDVECLVVDKDGEYGVGFYREDAKAWDSPNWGWLERKDRVDNKEIFTQPCGIGKVIAWIPVVPKPYKTESEVQDADCD